MSTPRHRVIGVGLDDSEFGDDKKNNRKRLLTPHSLTPTPVNIDAERTASVRKRKAKRVRSMLAQQFNAEPSAASQNNTAPKQTQFTPAEIQAMLERTLKHATEKKINDSNAWDYHLLDCLPDLIKEQRRTGGAAAYDFSKAGLQLDAGVMIYDKRVDSTYRQAMDSIALAPKTTRGDQGEGGDDDAGGEGAGGEGQGRGRRHRELDPSSTLVEPEQIRGKEPRVTFETDPLFVRTSALFDKGGAEGLLMNNLGTYNGYTLLFDSEVVPEQAFSHQCSSAASTALVDLSSLSSFKALLEQPPHMETGIEELELLLGTAAAQPEAAAAEVAALVQEAMQSRQRAATPAAPGPVRIYRPRSARAAAADAEGTAPNEQHDAAAMQEEPAAGMYDDAAAGAEVEMVEDLGAGAGDDEQSYQQQFDDSAAGYDAVAEFQASLQAELEEGADDGGAGGGDDWGADAADDSDGEQQASGTQGQQQAAAQGQAAQSAEWLTRLAAGHLDHASSSWQGKGTWRFKGAAAADKAAKLQAARASRASKTKGKAVDFEDPPPLPEFKPGTRKSTCLQRRTKAKTMKPPKTSYDVTRFARPFGLDDVTISSFWVQPQQPAAGEQEQEHGAWGTGAEGTAAGAADYGDDDGAGGFGDYGDDFGGGGDDWGDGDGDGEQQDECAEAIALLQAPRRVAKTGINYSRAAKQVDVKALKDIVWSGLVRSRDDGSPAGGEQASAGSIQFQDIISQVPARSRAGDLQDLSVHLCFICLLHLANENGLVVEAQDLKTLSVGNVPVARA